MALVFCPECGEETLDRLANCPLCNEQLVDKEVENTTKHARLITFSAAFLGGLVAATLCNIMGYTALAIGFGLAGVLSMAVLIFKLNTI